MWIVDGFDGSFEVWMRLERRNNTGRGRGAAGAGRRTRTRTDERKDGLEADNQSKEVEIGERERGNSRSIDDVRYDEEAPNITRVDCLES